MLLVLVSWIFVIFHANIALIIGKGQNYADRGYIHAGVGITVEEDDFATELYDWYHDGPEVIRWNVEEYPHPQLEPRACRRTVSSNLCDPEEILTEEQAEELDLSIRRLYNETPCICDVCGSSDGGIQIGIALLRRTYKPYNEHPSKIIHSFSKNLRSKWRLGQCEDDLLIVVATEDRQSYTSVGRATQRYISNREAYRIFLANKAHFSAGLYFEGLRDMLRDYYEASRYFGKSTNNDDELSKGGIVGIIAAVVLVIGLLLIIAVWLYKMWKRKQETEDPEFSAENSKSSSWHRKDMKLFLPSFMSKSDTAYGPCKTKEEESASVEKAKQIEDEEIINTELAPPEPQNLTSEEGNSSSNCQNDSSVVPNSSDDSPQIVVVSSETPQTNSNNGSNSAKMQTFVPKTPKNFQQTDM